MCNSHVTGSVSRITTHRSTKLCSNSAKPRRFRISFISQPSIANIRCDEKFKFIFIADDRRRPQGAVWLRRESQTNLELHAHIVATFLFRFVLLSLIRLSHRDAWCNWEPSWTGLSRIAPESSRSHRLRPWNDRLHNETETGAAMMTRLTVTWKIFFRFSICLVPSIHQTTSRAENKRRNFLISITMASLLGGTIV